MQRDDEPACQLIRSQFVYGLLLGGLARHNHCNTLTQLVHCVSDLGDCDRTRLKKASLLATLAMVLKTAYRLFTVVKRVSLLADLRVGHSSLPYRSLPQKSIS